MYKVGDILDDFQECPILVTKVVGSMITIDILMLRPRTLHNYRNFSNMWYPTTLSSTDGFIGKLTKLGNVNPELLEVLGFMGKDGWLFR